MLDVYMDEKMYKEWCKKIEITKEDLLKKEIASKVESFIKLHCKLYLDRPKKNSSIYTKITQGMGDNTKPKIINFNDLTINNTDIWSFFLLSDDNPLQEKAKKNYHTVGETEFDEAIEKLLFIHKKQRTILSIIPHSLRKHQRFESNVKDNLQFNGWSSFEEIDLAPLTDVVIIDPYFLRPEFFKVSDNDRNSNHDESKYSDKCLLPLMNALEKFAINNKYNLLVITVIGKTVKDNPDDIDFAERLFIKMSDLISASGLKVNFSLAVLKFLNSHKRIIYSNFFSLKTNLSIHHFESNKIHGSNIEDIQISPFAFETGYHEASLKEIAELASRIKDGNAEKSIFSKNTYIKNRLLDDAFNYCVKKSKAQ